MRKVIIKEGWNSLPTKNYKIMKKDTITIIIAITLTLAITGTCLYFNSGQANVLCFIATWVLGVIAGGIIYHKEDWEDEAEEQLSRFDIAYIFLNVIMWFIIFYRYNTSFYEKTTRHNVIRKEIVPAGYKIPARFILICEDTVIETGIQSYHSINPPQIIYHTEEIR
jgi:hypothetical protein